MDAALSGPTGRIVLGATPLTIGRLPENQVVLNDSKASSRHAEIRPDAAGYVVMDLGSSTGTFVNEQRLVPQTSRRLHVGDVLRVGDTTYIYESLAQTGVASSAYKSSDALSNESALSTGVDQEGEFPEYQAFSPVYASPMQLTSSPVQQESVSSSSSSDPLQAGRPPEYQSLSVKLETKKKRDRRLWATMGVIAGVLILLVGACAILLVVNVPTADKALDAFCTDIKNKDGQAASRLFSDEVLKGQASGVTGFISVVSSGQIPNCVHTSAKLSNQSATAQIVLTTSIGSKQTDDVRLTTDSNGNWKIADLKVVQ